MSILVIADGLYCSIPQATVKGKYGYSTDKAAKAVDIVMEQTKQFMCTNESSRYQYEPIICEILQVAEKKQ
jgi:hypothetical protein